MAEPYFQFKQFRIYHAAAGFKVGTDAVLIGAWTSVKDGDRVLDIGTGTGIIALMLAQRAHISVDAVEIDPVVAWQASMNVARSPFSNVHVHCSDLKEFVKTKNQYDVIVSNPPYFSHAQPPKDPSIHLAKHTVALDPANLFMAVSQLLSPDGSFSVIFPVTELEVFENAASSNGLYPQEKVNVYPFPDSNVIRLMVRYSKTEKEIPESSEFYIAASTERHDYSEQYRSLTRDYFLRF